MGTLKRTRSHLNDASVFTTEPFQDNRGVFGRFFCQNELAPILNGKTIKAVNFSQTNKVGALRGLHYQKAPFEEIKMVRCLRGKVFDVMVDFRENSSTYLQWHGEILTPGNLKMMFIPEGFAHGFQVLEEKSELLYLHTEEYNSAYEAGVHYSDPTLGIEWPLEITEVSDKDRTLPFVKLR